MISRHKYLIWKRWTLCFQTRICLKALGFHTIYIIIYILETFFLTPWPTHNRNRLHNFGMGTSKGSFLWSLVNTQWAVSDEMFKKNVVRWTTTDSCFDNRGSHIELTLISEHQKVASISKICRVTQIIKIYYVWISENLYFFMPWYVCKQNMIIKTNKQLHGLYLL